MGDTCKDSQKPLTGIHLVQKKNKFSLKKTNTICCGYTLIIRGKKTFKKKTKMYSEKQWCWVAMDLPCRISQNTKLPQIRICMHFS